MKKRLFPVKRPRGRVPMPEINEEELKEYLKKKDVPSKVPDTGQFYIDERLSAQEEQQKMMPPEEPSPPPQEMTPMPGLMLSFSPLLIVR